MKTLSTFVLLLAGIACGPVAFAQNNAPAPSQPAKKAPPKKAPVANKESTADDEKEPDITGMTPTPFECELGNKLTIYRNDADDQQIALIWNKRTHQMMRVSTTTGAQRYENPKKGLVWIGIPAKGMLLDSKKGQQLANECKSPDQVSQKAPEKG